LALQFLRYENAQVILFDKGASCRAAVLAAGGQFSNLDDPKSGIAFQPLRYIDQPSEQLWAMSWLEMLCTLQGVTVSHDIRRSIEQALGLLASEAEDERTLAAFVDFITDVPEVQKALRIYTSEGAYWRYLDQIESGFDYHRIQAFEMGSFLADADEDGGKKALVQPVLDYLFHRLSDRFDGRPTLLIIDEAWSFFLEQRFSAKLNDWLATSRKRNVSIVLATLRVGDVVSSPICGNLIEQTMSRIFLANPKAENPTVREHYASLGLNDQQIRIIQMMTPKRDYYYMSDAGNRRFELGLGLAALAFCGASTAKDQALIDELYAQHGTGTAFAHAWLEARGLEAEAAELLRFDTEIAALMGEAA